MHWSITGRVNVFCATSLCLSAVCFIDDGVGETWALKGGGGKGLICANDKLVSFFNRIGGF